jgi:hypothetical protein
MNSHWLSHTIDKGFLGQWLLIRAGQLQHCGRTVEVICCENWGNAAAQASNRAVAMHLAVARIHVAEVALAINNLANKINFAYGFRCHLILLSVIERSN